VNNGALKRETVEKIGGQKQRIGSRSAREGRLTNSDERQRKEREGRGGSEDEGFVLLRRPGHYSMARRETRVGFEREKERLQPQQSKKN